MRGHNMRLLILTLMALCLVILGIASPGHAASGHVVIPVAQATAAPQPTPKLDAGLSAQADGVLQEAIDLLNKGDDKGALDKSTQAVGLYENAGDKGGEALALLYQGFAYVQLEQYDQALNSYSRSLQLARDLGDAQLESAALDNTGLVYVQKGEYDRGLSYYLQAVDAAQQAGDSQSANNIIDHIKDLGSTLNKLGNDYNNKGQFDQALVYLQKALTIAEEVGDRETEGAARANIGFVYDNKGLYDQALDYYGQALDIARETGNRSGEATTLLNMSTVYKHRGEYDKAQDSAQTANSIYHDLKDYSGEGSTLNIMGAIANDQGEYAQAFNYYQQALDLVRKAGDRKTEGDVLNDLGFIFVNQGDYDRALDYFNQSLDVTRSVGDKSGEGATLANIAYIYYSKGDNDKALSNYLNALAIKREVGNSQDEGVILNNIGQLYSQQQEYSKANDYFAQALEIDRAVGNRMGEATVLSNVGSIYEDQGQHDKALTNFQQALAIFKEIDDRQSQSTVLSNIGAVYEGQGRLDQALSMNRQSIDLFETIRQSARVEEFKTGLTAQSAGIYGSTVLLLVKLGQPEEAFNMAERARARTFLDQIGNTKLNIRSGADTQLVQQEEDTRTQLAVLDRNISQERARPSSEQNAALLKSMLAQQTTKQQEYSDLLTRLKLSNPEYASMVSVSPSTLTETQKLLDDKTTLLSYFVTPDKTLAFVVRRDFFKMVELDVKEADLQGAITDFRAFASVEDQTPQSLVKLYDWLLAPVKVYLTTPVLGIVPNGELHYLPFAALSDGKKYLSEDYVLFSLPSTSALPYVQGKEKQAQGATPLLALAEGHAEGLPALQNADKEAQAVAELYGTQPLLDDKATEETFGQKAGESYLVHIAAHGQLNTANPLFSRVVLAPDAAGKSDGSLEVHEVYELDLKKTDLVVLSACQTNLGAQSKGDDIVGLNRAFIYAGTPSVIASLWSVDDAATSLLMTSFYTHLKAGEGKAEALRSAQAETRAKYPNPYYWAAFVLTGSPGTTKAFASGAQGTLQAPSTQMLVVFVALAVVLGGAVLAAGLWLVMRRRSRRVAV